MNYLYNGIPLPAPPEAPYKYNFIIPTYGGGYAFISSPVPWIVKTGGSLNVAKKHGTVSYLSYYYDELDPSWSEPYESTKSYSQSDIYKPIWANFYVLNEDGTLYLAASDHVPQINPAALMHGFLSMASVRSNE